jgi:hypothetical protein
VSTDFEDGLMVGLLIGEGHFGGDGRQPQVTLRMHVRHDALMRWLERTFPGGKVYGPYEHGGRRYLQWMARGSYLRDQVVPLLERHLSPRLDGYSWERFERMRVMYASRLGPAVDGARNLGSGGIEKAAKGARRPHLGPVAAPTDVEKIFDRLRRARQETLDPDNVDGKDEGP